MFLPAHSVYSAVGTSADWRLSVLEERLFQAPAFARRGGFDRFPTELRLEPDAMLWLIHKVVDEDGGLDSGTQLSDLRLITGGSGGNTVRYSGPGSASLNELRASVAEERTIGELYVRLKAFKQVYSFHYSQQGQAAPVVSETTAWQDIGDLSRKRMAIIYDIYCRIVPLLRRLYRADSARWDAKGRNQFRSECKQALAADYSA